MTQYNNAAEDLHHEWATCELKLTPLGEAALHATPQPTVQAALEQTAKDEESPTSDESSEEDAEIKITPIMISTGILKGIDQVRGGVLQCLPCKSRLSL